MNSKLYVGNLSHSTIEETLWELFSQSGAVVSVDLIRDRLTRKSKEFAFITMSSWLEAEKAIEMFNGYRLDESEIRVRFAQKREGLHPIENDQSLHPVRRVRNKRS